MTLYQILILVAAFLVPLFSIVGVYVSVKVALAQLQVEIEHLKCDVKNLTVKVENLLNKYKNE